MRALILAAWVAGAMAAIGSAQSTTGRTGSDHQTQAQKVPTLTVAGCLRESYEPDAFILSDLEWREPAKPAGTTGETDASGAPAGAAGAVTLRLVDAAGSTRLREHVGHKVEITGTLIDEPRPDAGPAERAAERTGTGGDQTSRTGEANTRVQSQHTLNVRTVKMIADTCSGLRPDGKW